MSGNVEIKEWKSFDAFKYWKEVKIKNKEGVVVIRNRVDTYDSSQFSQSSSNLCIENNKKHESSLGTKRMLRSEA